MVDAGESNVPAETGFRCVTSFLGYGFSQRFHGEVSILTSTSAAFRWAIRLNKVGKANTGAKVSRSSSDLFCIMDPPYRRLCFALQNAKTAFEGDLLVVGSKIGLHN